MKEKKKPYILEQKLLKYSLTAGAVLTGAQNINAGVDYTHAGTTLSTNGESFDVVFGGEHKFTINFNSFPGASTFPYWRKVTIGYETYSAYWAVTGGHVAARSNSYSV
ncbi:MAG: hypothetical protein GY936_01825 [Ignavibacteriae bacterium]|nr:hypothetical protein [Ignavibacteriota bacterium]